MQTFSDVELPEGFNENARIREALVAAYWGEFERAIASVTAFLAEDPPQALAIFALRETIPWRVEIGDVDRAALDADICSQLAVDLWGQLDPRTMIIRNTQMYWVGKVGRQQSAERLAESLLADAQVTLEGTDPLHLAIRNNAARILEFGESRGRAEELYRDLLADFESIGEAESECGLTTRDNYAEFLAAEERYGDSCAVMREQVVHLTRAFGRSSELTLRARFHIGLLMMEDGEFEGGVEQLEELAKDCSRYLDLGSDLLTLVFQALLAAALTAGRPQDIVTNCDRMLGQLEFIAEPTSDAVLELKRLRNRYREMCTTAKA